ncbi:HAD-like domain-containing protein [Syncephalastrum racemosum]|uniref:Mitochondrial import inner membrane translocase subunit TIM50 n=1 Tax=Syncephalastrum racemosum TaxID=13706 RepID=A0A1X2H608_SYNRA|nr:HAD-like domain-containing protein [Syncephalastrum racemosum]
MFGQVQQLSVVRQRLNAIMTAVSGAQRWRVTQQTPLASLSNTTTMTNDNNESGSKSTSLSADAAPFTPSSNAPAFGPTEAYKTVSLEPSVEQDSPSKKLLILDLNGTLVSRIQKSSMYVRPYQDRFLDYIFEHFTVMVWSSAQPHSVARMCRLFNQHSPNLKLMWDRSHFGLSRADYNRKCATHKNLDRVWAVLTEFDATNTVLLDDSPAKAVFQPYNSLHLSEFDHKNPLFQKHGERELLHVMRYLDILRKQSNVCSYMRQNPYTPSSPAEDPDQENSFSVYHYVYQRTDRRLVDFRPRPIQNASAEEDIDKVAEKMGAVHL